MGDCKATVHVSPAPKLVDHICLRNCQLPLPCAPEVWHRPGQRQPCTMSLKLSCSSIAASAAEDNVSLSLDYGKLFRLIEGHIRQWPDVKEVASRKLQVVGLNGQSLNGFPSIDRGQDITLVAGEIAGLALGYLDARGLEINAMRANAIQRDFGQCDITLHLPNALLRSAGGLEYRSLSSLGRNCDGATVAVVTEEDFRISDIRCHCIIGINPHERLEKQAVIVSLEFNTHGRDQYRKQFLETYQEMTRVVAEEVDKTTFQSVESLVTFIARIVTVDFGNQQVTVRAEKPSALAFAEGTGVEVTRSREFFKADVITTPPVFRMQSISPQLYPNITAFSGALILVFLLIYFSLI